MLRMTHSHRAHPGAGRAVRNTAQRASSFARIYSKHGGIVPRRTARGDARLITTSLHALPRRGTLILSLCAPRIGALSDITCRACTALILAHGGNRGISRRGARARI